MWNGKFLILRMLCLSSVGGCCGEIAVHKSRRTNFVIATQEYEYKISNVMDKSLESVLGMCVFPPSISQGYSLSLSLSH